MGERLWLRDLLKLLERRLGCLLGDITKGIGLSPLR
jgi:hypothetical protein